MIYSYWTKASVQLPLRILVFNSSSMSISELGEALSSPVDILTNFASLTLPGETHKHGFIDNTAHFVVSLSSLLNSLLWCPIPWRPVDFHIYTLCFLWWVVGQSLNLPFVASGLGTLNDAVLYFGISKSKCLLVLSIFTDLVFNQPKNLKYLLNT